MIYHTYPIFLKKVFYGRDIIGIHAHEIPLINIRDITLKWQKMRRFGLDYKVK